MSAFIQIELRRISEGENPKLYRVHIDAIRFYKDYEIGFFQSLNPWREEVIYKTSLTAVELDELIAEARPSAHSGT